MKEKINKLFTSLLSSFDNNSEGMSAKKLSSFATMSAYLYAHKFVNADNLVLVLGVDSALVVALLGINALEKAKDKKSKPDLSNDTPS